MKRRKENKTNKEELRKAFKDTAYDKDIRTSTVSALSSNRRSWKKWILVLKPTAIFYFKDKKAIERGSPKNLLPLGFLHAGPSVSKVPKMKKAYSASYFHTYDYAGNVTHFLASSPEDRDEWIDKINKASNNFLLQRLSRQSITRGVKISSGSSGDVFLETFSSFPEPVVTKVQRIGPSEGAVWGQRMKSLKEMSHANLLKIIQYEVGDSELRTTTEFCRCGSADNLLSNLVETGERLSEAELVFISKQILAGLCYLNSVNSFHGNLHPENVLFKPSGLLKLADYGLPNENSTGGGYPYWTAPEVLKDASLKTSKSDSWSLGMIIFTLATGSNPFEGSSEDEARSKIMTGDPPELPRNLKLSKNFRKFVSLMLIKNLEDRWDPKNLLMLPLFEKFKEPQNCLVSRLKEVSEAMEDLWNNGITSEEEGESTESGSMESGEEGSMVLNSEDSMNSMVVNDDDSMNSMIVNSDSMNSMIVNSDSMNSMVVNDDDSMNSMVVNSDGEGSMIETNKDALKAKKKFVPAFQILIDSLNEKEIDKDEERKNYVRTLDTKTIRGILVHYKNLEEKEIQKCREKYARRKELIKSIIRERA